MKRSFIRCSVRSSFMVLLVSVAVLVCGLGAPQKAWAHASGISGYSGKTGSICNSCHSGGTTPTVVLTGPTSLATSSTAVYTLTITGGAAVVGGLDVAKSAGTLQATGPNTQLMSGEVTQTAATSFSGGSLAFTFTLVAPSTAGTVTLYAAGLSANGNGSTSGDKAAATTLAVTVTSAATAPHIVVTDPIAPATDLQIPFGTITDGLTSDQTVTVSNSGNANLIIGTIASANPLAAPFSITTDNCSGKTIAPAGACTITVRFAPTAATASSDSFDIPSNDPGTATVTMSVSGTGTATPAPHIVVTDSIAPAGDLSIPFGNVTDGLTSDQTVTVTNSGNANLIIGTIASADPLAAPFSITTDNCSGKTIAPAGACAITVRFAPTAATASSDSFDIPSNDSATPSVTMNVSGTGLSAATNNPPSAPTMVSPLDGQTGVGTTATLEWTKSTDPDNDPLTYHVYDCTDNTFASCTPVDVASRGRAGIYFAGSGLLFFGFVFTRGNRGKMLMLALMLGMVLTTGALVTSCGKSSGSSTPAPVSTGITYQASGLSSATTYYWKVIADDGKGGLASSATWSFTTQ
jgi:HYDIN/CFA65/VesB-like, Ig-like domain